MRLLPAIWTAFVAIGLALPARADVNLIVNGDFESTTMTTATQIGYATTTNGVTNNNTVTGWTNTNTGYNFIFFAGNSTSTGQYGNFSLYTSANGGTGGNATLNSPTGGNIVAADGAFGVSAITQSLTGLTIGTNYQLTFWWAGAQQTGYTGPTTEAWNVTFGNQTYGTGAVSTPSQGFSAWRQASFVFQATAANQVLSFLAAGTPGGQPPISLLDGVSLVAAFEPSSLALCLVGLAAAAVVRRRRRA